MNTTSVHTQAVKRPSILKRALILAVIALAVAIGGLFLWLNFGRGEGPAELGLSTPVSDEYNGQNGATLENADGTWTVIAGSEAGYRVVEDLRGVKDFEAVGRTQSVTGSMTIAGSTLSAASFEVEVGSITSDSTQRDNAFKGNILSTGEFPTAVFVLTEAVDFGSIPAAGEVRSFTAKGDLTLRGQTREVTFEGQAQVLDGKIEVAGSVAVVFSDFGIDNPSNAAVTVRDEGKVEVKLLLEQN